MNAEDLDNTPRVRPFSNGTDGMVWMDNNCHECACSTYDDINLDNGEMIERVNQGRHCEAEIHMAYSQVDGAVWIEIAKWVGWTENSGWPRNCQGYRNQYPPGHPLGMQPPGSPIADNQLVLPFQPIWLEVGRSPVICGTEIPIHPNRAN